MEKLDKLGTGNVPIPPKYTKPVLAGELNRVIEKINEVVDEVESLSEPTTPTYYTYAATITQSGTDAPVATILVNSLGTTTWARTSAGTYTATTDGLFVSGKTIPNANVETFIDEVTGNKINAVWTSANVITITTTDENDVLTDDILENRYIEFTVYN